MSAHQVEKDFRVGQQSLSNFYQSVIFDDPRTAARLSNDVLDVAINSMAPDGSESHKRGQESADKLIRASFDLPVVQQRVLQGALVALGFRC